MSRLLGATLNVPPKYNIRGRRQLWFVESDNEKVDDVVNGVLTAFVVFAPLIAAGGLL
ncbi:hypothetical protein ACH9L7_20345 (plasmid) [Haloferax sp. S1W]|uniref:hypothetical protein n=1 Tax=Haloferax sp. S1W TaxID=3377110 RepID=UPI0037C5C6A0